MTTRPKRFYAPPLLILLMASCSVFSLDANPDEEEFDLERQFDHGGLSRSYRLHLPPDYQDHPQPLLVVLHGGGMNGREMQMVTRLDQVADEYGFIVAYPDASPDWAVGCDCTEADLAGVNDIEFISHLIDEIDDEFGIVRSRVLLAGLSQGGTMAYRMACESDERLTAVAIVAASMSIAQAERCSPSGRVPMVLILGTEDLHYSWYPPTDDEPRYGLSAEETIAFWAENNGCTGERGAAHLYTEPISQISVFEETFETCAVGGNLVVYRLEGGGHDWPIGQWSASWTIGDYLRQH